MHVWVEAARPRTLPAAIAPVLVGTAVAAGEQVIAWRAGAALVVALAVQVAVNYANDYFDGVAGIDTPERAGPPRAVATGLVAPSRMRTAMLAALAVAALAGLALSAAAGWWLIAVGAVCFAAALGYSGGRRPYASAGLGELFVFVFFGLVATAGSAIVHEPGGFAVVVAITAGVPVGLLATAILVVNNLRDIPTDRAVGKRTLAVRLGERGTRVLYATCLLLPFAFAAAVFDTAFLLTLLAFPLAVPPLRAVLGGASGRSLIPALAATGRVQLAFAVLFAVGALVVQ